MFTFPHESFAALEAGEIFIVYNKRDLLPEGQAQRMADVAGGLALSALEPESARHLMNVVQARLWERSYGEAVPAHEDEAARGDSGHAPIITRVEVGASSNAGTSEPGE